MSGTFSIYANVCIIIKLLLLHFEHTKVRYNISKVRYNVMFRFYCRKQNYHMHVFTAANAFDLFVGSVSSKHVDNAFVIYVQIIIENL